MKELKLTDLIEVHILQKIQDEFSRYTGLAALTTDADGNPITEGSGFTDFCMNYTRKSELGCARCVASDKNAAITAMETGKPTVYVCHAGLADFASPIMVGNKLVGCFLGGQVRISEIDEEKLKVIADELGIEFEPYYEAMKKASHVSKRTIQKSAEFLGIITNVISEMAYQNYMAIDKYRNLERSARSQSHFLMDLSLDLHKNMSEWISALEEVVKNGSVDTVMDVIDTMLSNGNTTYSIIGDIVDYMKFSDGNVELYETPYRIREVLQVVAELEAEEVKAKNIQLTYEVGDEVPETMLGDAGRIGQMLVKLILKVVGQKGRRKRESGLHIAVHANKFSYSHTLTITVWDKSQDFKTEEVEALQRYFSRDILGLQSKEEASQYALSIVDLFVRQMRGQISVENRNGEGTVFVISLPQLEVPGEEGD